MSAVDTSRTEINELKRKINELKIQNEALALQNNDYHARLIKLHAYATREAWQEGHNRQTMTGKIRTLTQGF